MKEDIIKALRDPRKAASVLTHRVLAPIGHQNFRRFIVLTRDRTGSNMLTQSLNSHPRVAADYEIFAKLRGRTEREILDRAFGRQPFYICAKGFKIFYYHPQDAECSQVWDMLAAIEGLHVIHLKRRNILEALVSERLAYVTGVYGVRTEQEAAAYRRSIPKVQFTVEGLERGFRRTRQWERDGIARFSGRPIIEIEYEQLVADMPGQFRRITDFLGVSPRPARTDFKKQGKRNLRKIVRNYDELAAAFADTEWAPFFRDSDPVSLGRGLRI